MDLLSLGQDMMDSVCSHLDMRSVYRVSACCRGLRPVTRYRPALLKRYHEEGFGVSREGDIVTILRNPDYYLTRVAKFARICYRAMPTFRVDFIHIRSSTTVEYFSHALGLKILSAYTVGAQAIENWENFYTRASMYQTLIDLMCESKPRFIVTNGPFGDTWKSLELDIYYLLGKEALLKIREVTVGTLVINIRDIIGSGVTANPTENIVMVMKQEYDEATSTGRDTLKPDVDMVPFADWSGQSLILAVRHSSPGPVV